MRLLRLTPMRLALLPAILAAVYSITVPTVRWHAAAAAWLPTLATCDSYLLGSAPPRGPLRLAYSGGTLAVGTAPPGLAPDALRLLLLQAAGDGMLRALQRHMRLDVKKVDMRPAADGLEVHVLGVDRGGYCGNDRSPWRPWVVNLFYDGRTGAVSRLPSDRCERFTEEVRWVELAVRGSFRRPRITPGEPVGTFE